MNIRRTVITLSHYTMKTTSLLPATCSLHAHRSPLWSPSGMHLLPGYEFTRGPSGHLRIFSRVRLLGRILHIPPSDTEAATHVPGKRTKAQGRGALSLGCKHKCTQAPGSSHTGAHVRTLEGLKQYNIVIGAAVVCSSPLPKSPPQAFPLL